jgi:hypothetical protein
MRPFFLIDARKVRPSYPARPWVDEVTLVEMREAPAIGTRLLCQRSFPMIIRAEELVARAEQLGKLADQAVDASYARCLRQRAREWRAMAAEIGVLQRDPFYRYIQDRIDAKSLQ